MSSGDWMAADYSIKHGLPGPYIMPMPVPMPTLYNGETKKPKLGIIELVLYNIAAMLAGVATGYDVRMSNVSPIHPRLYPRIADGDEEPTRWWFQANTGSNHGSGYFNTDYEFTSPSGYLHNTYHGPARHYRPFLSSMGGIAPGLPPNIIEKQPLRFTDSPQHYAAGGSGSNVPTPSPRRKNSCTSNDDNYTSETGRLERIDRLSSVYISNVPPYPDYGTVPPVYTMMPPPPDYYRPESGYFLSSDYHDRMLECQEFPHAYDNPSNVNNLARGGSRLTSYSHRRTSSNLSNTSITSQNNLNPTFRLDDELEYTPTVSTTTLQFSSPTHYYQRLPNYGSSIINYDYSGIPYLTRQNSHDSSNPNNTSVNNLTTASTTTTIATISNNDRPCNLEVATRLRSSLKRTNYSYNSPKSTSKNNSESGTPTNPTPPDSLTSEDSSYVSAKDSQISISRVRFSPVTFERDNLSRERVIERERDRDDLQTGQDIISNRRLSRSRKPSVTELDKEFLS